MFVFGFVLGVIATLSAMWVWYVYTTPAVTGIESDDERK